MNRVQQLAVQATLVAIALAACLGTGLHLVHPGATCCHGRLVSHLSTTNVDQVTSCELGCQSHCGDEPACDRTQALSRLSHTGCATCPAGFADRWVENSCLGHSSTDCGDLCWVCAFVGMAKDRADLASGQISVTYLVAPLALKDQGAANSSPIASFSPRGPPVVSLS